MKKRHRAASEVFRSQNMIQQQAQPVRLKAKQDGNRIYIGFSCGKKLRVAFIEK